MITVVLAVVHVVVALVLIVVILLQSGKAGDLSTAFGGATETLFGTRAGTFFSKLTTILAIVFMITSLTLAIVTAKGLGPLTR
ncbi:MAG: preprotein translocase subunit SecG [Candidatus Omnitrophica bacterium]|nr:preprotein translocase subunit SecG [Candidatus Omnitrophota bacterium]